MKVVYFADASADVARVMRAGLPADWDFEVMPDGAVGDLGVLADVDVIIAGNVGVRQAHVAATPRLRLVQKTGVGFDGLDIEALRAAGVPVAVCPVASVEAVAEHAVMLILSTARRLMLTAGAVASGGWPRWEYQPEIKGVAGATVGVLGFGRIGQAVAQRLLPFGVTLKAMRRPRDEQQRAWWETQGVTFVEDAEALFQDADIVTLHVPLTPETSGLVGRSLLERMRPGGLLVNLARGDVVVEEDLVALLRTGHLGGAGIDTLSKEPPDGSCALVGMRNVIITPHLGGGGTAVLEAKLPAIVDNIRRRINGEDVQWRVA